MKKLILVFLLTPMCIICLAQSKIVGSWISEDSVNRRHFFAKKDGTIEERYCSISDDIWVQKPKVGKYKFVKGALIITWIEKIVEKREIFFDKDYNKVTIKIKEAASGLYYKYTFKRILDEEIIINE